MKKLIAIFLSVSVLLLPMSARRRWIPKIASAGGILGVNTDPGTSDTWPGGATVYGRFQATASGTMQNAFILYRGTGIQICKIYVYSTTSSGAPTSTDLLVGTSSTITSPGSAGWASAAMSGGTITAGQYYWVGFASSASSATMSFADSLTTTTYARASDGGAYFTSAPANLGGGGFNPSALEGDMSIYITLL